MDADAIYAMAYCEPGPQHMLSLHHDQSVTESMTEWDRFQSYEYRKFGLISNLNPDFLIVQHSICCRFLPGYSWEHFTISIIFLWTFFSLGFKFHAPQYFHLVC